MFQWVSFIGLGAVSAAIMSSADSTVLSTSSMFVHNIYKTVFFPKVKTLTEFIFNYLFSLILFSHTVVRKTSSTCHVGIHRCIGKPRHPNGRDREHYLRVDVNRIKRNPSLFVVELKMLFFRYLCADVVYVVLFPQLLLVLYAGDYTNTYGCLTAFSTGFTLRVLSRTLSSINNNIKI